uniref:Uncharacterized protein n=1 Tax=viral metagenome TaxID=1070528 RepID=A0A2V0RIT9_9ZZZZ
MVHDNRVLPSMIPFLKENTGDILLGNRVVAVLKDHHASVMQVLHFVICNVKVIEDVEDSNDMLPDETGHSNPDLAVNN